MSICLIWDLHSARSLIGYLNSITPTLLFLLFIHSKPFKIKVFRLLHARNLFSLSSFLDFLPVPVPVPESNHKKRIKYSNSCLYYRVTHIYLQKNISCISRFFISYIFNNKILIPYYITNYNNNSQHAFGCVNNLSQIHLHRLCTS